MKPPSERLIPGAQAPGFDELLRPHLDPLYRLAYRLTGQMADAQDLLQDLLVKLYERRDELSSIAELKPWASRVLYNLFVDRQRAYQRRRMHLVEPVAQQGGTDFIERVESQALGPAASAEREFDINLLSDALAVLSLEHRSVLLMHDAEGYKLDEIHRITGTPIGTLKSRLHRARARIREELASMEPFGAGQRVKGEKA